MSMGISSIVVLIVGALGCMSVVALLGVAVYLLVEKRADRRD